MVQVGEAALGQRAAAQDKAADVIAKMREAIALYRSLGFRETRPYLAEPTPGSLCFALSL